MNVVFKFYMYLSYIVTMNRIKLGVFDLDLCCTIGIFRYFSAFLVVASDLRCVHSTTPGLIKNAELQTVLLREQLCWHASRVLLAV